MIAAFATVATAVLIWAMVGFVLETVDQDGSKIMAALRGQSLLTRPTVDQIGAISVRYRSRSTAVTGPARALPRALPMPVGVEWRAAA